MSRKLTGILAAAALASSLSGAVFADEHFGYATLLGDPLPADGPVDQVVKVDGSTRWVNVLQNESVRFVVGSTTFAWRFPVDRAAVNLKDIAPSGVIDRDLYVYVAPDNLYTSGD
jgi:heavy-metal resistance protein CzcE